MRKILVLSCILFFAIKCYSQKGSLSDPEPYFAALIVENIDRSIGWYADNLGFELLNKKEFAAAGFKQANLKRGYALLELIELASSISAKTAIPDYTNKTRVQGIFKVGYKVADFDAWLSHLTESEVEFHGDVVVDELSGKRMVILKDPDGNRIQIFEN